MESYGRNEKLWRVMEETKSYGELWKKINKIIVSKVSLSHNDI